MSHQRVPQPASCPLCGNPRVSLFCRVPGQEREGRLWEIWKCEQCEYGWTLPEIDPEELAGYYPEAYLGGTRKMLAEFSAGTLQRHRSWRRETEKVELIERLLPSGRILDVGASNGSFLLALQEQGWQPSGVERIREVVELVREQHPGLDLRTGNIFSADFEPDSFDIVTFWHVFEHLPHPERVLTRVRELLKTGGRVVISVPNFASYQSHLFRAHWYAFDVPRHLHHFSPAALEYLFTKTGFRLREHLFFSRYYNFHQLKHSLINWSEERLSSRIPYYLLKPGLFLFQWAERLGSRYGALTSIGQAGGMGIRDS